MNTLEKFLKFMNFQMTKPVHYGWFHIIWLGIVIGLSVFLIVKFKDSTDKQNRIILLTYGGVCIVLEVLKQLMFSFNIDSVTWSYKWWAFPFQFCSTPMYVSLLAGIIKKGKVQDSLFAFLATFGLFGGLSFMFYPNDVFTSTVAINFQTMIHHGGQVVIGVYLLARNRNVFNNKTIFKAATVFSALLFIAIILNVVSYHIESMGNMNMFFVGPYVASTLPVASIIYPLVPWLIFIILYVLLFTVAGYFMLLISQLVLKLCRTPRTKEIPKA